MSGELVQVWQERDGTWRWRYVLLDHTELRTNRGYESIEEAVRSARQAHPGVAILGPMGHSSANGSAPRRASLVRTAMISASTVFVLLSVLFAVRRLRRPVRRGR